MCMFSTPKISVPDTETPPPMPDAEDAKRVESVDFGGSSDSDTETASGVKGKAAKGKASLKIAKAAPIAKTTGANLQSTRIM